jgi:hypothetical protein
MQVGLDGAINPGTPGGNHPFGYRGNHLLEKKHPRALIGGVKLVYKISPFHTKFQG